MKNKIRLGISGVSSCLRSLKAKKPMSVTEDASHKASSLSLDNFTTISEFDLDEMYRRNLRMLDYIENFEASSNFSDQSSRLYHSSLNIYISSKESLKQSDDIYYNPNSASNLKKHNLEIITNSVSRKVASQFGKPSHYSSYEALYDDLKSTQKKEDHVDIAIPQPVKEKSNLVLNCKKSYKRSSSDSDKTLKSLSSEDSFSTVSSVDSENEEPKIQYHNQQGKTLFNSNYLENINSIPKVRPITRNPQMRPTSCCVDTKYGQYLSNKYPSRPNLVIIKRQVPNDKSNVVISKPLGHYPNRGLNNAVSMTNSNNVISKSIFNKSLSSLNNECRLPSDYRQYLSVNNGNSSFNNILNHQISQNEPDRNPYINRTTYKTAFPKLNKPEQMEHNNNKESDQTNHSKICTIQESKSQIFLNNNSTNSEKSNQNFIDLSFRSANNDRPHYIPSKGDQDVSISKICQIQKTKKS